MLLINTVIFDFDGVLIDSGEDISDAVNKTLLHFERPEIPIDKIISFVGDGALNLIKRCFNDADDELISKALNYYRDYYFNNPVVKTSLYPGVLDILKKLSEKGINTSIVTNKPEAITLKILELLGVSTYFDMVVTPEHIKNMKPHPEGLLKVMDKFCTKPCNTIMVGDAYTDIEAGRSAETHTCGVLYGLGNRELLKKASPDFLIEKMCELEKHIFA